MDNQTNLKKLSQKVTDILRNYNSLKEENQLMRNELITLKAENEVKNTQIQNLRDETLMKDLEIEEIVEQIESMLG
ncbi:hypothetical protein [Sulfurimonas sp.]|uniref:hypothetical protein n=1 Tax=Sulfurimonas sp. TaxID=2022749 RepID=UPI002B49B9F9|nr:hypothetical protein [Sulfurimonas sp.]